MRYFNGHYNMEPYLEEINASLPPHPSRISPPGETKIDLMTNNFRFDLDPASSVFIYSLSFTPNVEDLDRTVIRSLLASVKAQLTTTLGVFITCGTILFGKRDLEESPLCITKPHEEESKKGKKWEGPRLKLKSSHNNTTYKITVKKLGLLKTNSPSEGMCTRSMQFLNILVRSMLKELGFVQLGSYRNHFNEGKQTVLESVGLTILPGYFTSVNCYRDGLQLRVDLVHKVLRQQSMLQYMQEMMQEGGRSLIESQLKGAVVMPMYGNKTLFRVKSVIFDENPLTTFERAGKTVSFVQYFQERYGITIADKGQPLLDVGCPKNPEAKLIPELCRITGLSDKMVANRDLMTKVAEITRKTPDARFREVLELTRQLNSLRTNSQWSIAINPNPISVQGFQLPHTQIQVRGTTIPITPQAKFGLVNKEILTPISIDNWMVFFTQRDQEPAMALAEGLFKAGRSFGITVMKPRLVNVEPFGNKVEDRFIGAVMRETYPQLQIVLTLLPNQSKNIYSSLKQKLVKERPIPSQVVLLNTAKKNNMSIYSKIILQMAAKIGGELWHSILPRGFPSNTMIIGIDVCRSTFQGDVNVMGVCATLNPVLTRYWNQVGFQLQGVESSNILTTIILNALRQYYRVNNRSKPDYIVIYRDGVKPSQYHDVIQVEIAKVLSTLKSFDKDWNPHVTILVINKQVKARFYTRLQGATRNTPPGVVVESSVVASHYNFYLTAHSGDGTLTPTHYNVVFDDSGWGADLLEGLTNCLCLDYYNWTGAVRVPAPCMYARKLATLVAKHTKADFSANLAMQYFYL